MFGLYLPELLFLVLGVATLLGAYWLIRLAVRHGVADAHRRLPDQRDHAADESAAGAPPTTPNAD